jgi:peptidoglycan hydrolase-like protein with peptidoglycan-binding domain
MVRQIQEALGLTIDGFYGPKTEAAVIRFQSNNHIVADGIVGKYTLECLGILDTDSRGHLHYRTDNGLIITRHYLPKGEYLENEQPILNDYCFLHHTSGWDNPFNTIDAWNRDTRGKIGTEFVIGGQNVKNTDNTYDGVVVQAFPDGCQGWHLGATGSYYMNRHSVGIELNNFGYLSEDNKTYVGIPADESQIITLTEEFKGYKKWHRYSDAQLYSLQKLLLHISTRDNIDLHVGLVKWIHDQGATQAFGFQQEAYDGKIKGLLTHSNVRKDKFDCFPQQELIDMLLTL